MGKGVIKISHVVIAHWFVEGKRHDDIKEILKLPESYQIEDIAMDWQSENAFLGGSRYINITVSAEEIPERQGDELPLILSPVYRNIEGRSSVHLDPRSYELMEIEMHPAKAE